MAFRGLKLTWVCIANLFISCSIILSFKFKNSTFLLFPKHFSFCFYVPASDDIRKKIQIFRGSGYTFNEQNVNLYNICHVIELKNLIKNIKKIN